MYRALGTLIVVGMMGTVGCGDSGGSGGGGSSSSDKTSSSSAPLTLEQSDACKKYVECTTPTRSTGSRANSPLSTGTSTPRRPSRRLLTSSSTWAGTRIGSASRTADSSPSARVRSRFARKALQVRRCHPSSSFVGLWTMSSPTASTRSGTTALTRLHPSATGRERCWATQYPCFPLRPGRRGSTPSPDAT